MTEKKMKKVITGGRGSYFMRPRRHWHNGMKKKKSSNFKLYYAHLVYACRKTKNCSKILRSVGMDKFYLEMNGIANVILIKKRITKYTMFTYKQNKTFL